MIYNPTILSHVEEDVFNFESGLSQGIFLTWSQGVFPYQNYIRKLLSDHVYFYNCYTNKSELSFSPA